MLDNILEYHDAITIQFYSNHLIILFKRCKLDPVVDIENFDQVEAQQSTRHPCSIFMATCSWHPHNILVATCPCHTSSILIATCPNILMATWSQHPRSILTTTCPCHTPSIHIRWNCIKCHFQHRRQDQIKVMKVRRWGEC